jgi:hypothetical protein
MASYPAPWIPSPRQVMRDTAMNDLEAALGFAQCPGDANITFIQAKRFNGGGGNPKCVWRQGTLCHKHFVAHCGLIVTSDPRFNIATGTYGWHVMQGQLQTIILPKLFAYDILHIVRLGPPALIDVHCWKCKEKPRG